MQNTLKQKLGALIVEHRMVQFPADNQLRFAKRIGIGEKTMNNIETGQGNVGIDTYLAVFQTLALDNAIEELLTTIKSKTKQAPKW